MGGKQWILNCLSLFLNLKHQSYGFGGFVFLSYLKIYFYFFPIFLFWDQGLLFLKDFFFVLICILLNHHRAHAFSNKWGRNYCESVCHSFIPYMRHTSECLYKTKHSLLWWSQTCLISFFLWSFSKYSWFTGIFASFPSWLKFHFLGR